MQNKRTSNKRPKNATTPVRSATSGRKRTSVLKGQKIIPRSSRSGAVRRSPSTSPDESAARGDSWRAGLQGLKQTILLLLATFFTTLLILLKRGWFYIQGRKVAEPDRDADLLEDSADDSMDIPLLQPDDPDWVEEDHLDDDRAEHDWDSDIVEPWETEPDPLEMVHEDAKVEALAAEERPLSNEELEDQAAALRNIKQLNDDPVDKK